jgi:hypothetical protein
MPDNFWLSEGEWAAIAPAPADVWYNRLYLVSAHAHSGKVARQSGSCGRCTASLVHTRWRV